MQKGGKCSGPKLRDRDLGAINGRWQMELRRGKDGQKAWRAKKGTTPLEPQAYQGQKSLQRGKMTAGQESCQHCGQGEREGSRENRVALMPNTAEAEQEEGRKRPFEFSDTFSAKRLAIEENVPKQGSEKLKRICLK